MSVTERSVDRSMAAIGVTLEREGAPFTPGDRVRVHTETGVNGGIWYADDIVGQEGTVLDCCLPSDGSTGWAVEVEFHEGLLVQWVHAESVEYVEREENANV